jgi:uncharacterized iron-regulated membrane protein
MIFRRVLFWMHLAAGLFAGSVVFIMSFTGVILTYEKQMLAWADRKAAAIAAPTAGQTRAPLEDIAARVVAAVPNSTATTITRRQDPQAPVTVAMSNGRTLLVHPYTGALIGDAPTGMRRLFRASTDWHRYLGGEGEDRARGKAITGACNLAFLFLVLSGMYLWMPRRWTRAAVAAVIRPRWRHATGKARDFNWHNALGLWSAIPLAIIVASATVISYPWASDLAYRLAGEAPPPRPAAPAAPAAARPAGQPAMPAIADLDERWQAAEAHVGAWKAISLRMPSQANAPLVFTIDRGWGGQPQKRGTLTLDGATGSVVRWDTFAQQSPGRRFRSVLRFAHTGEVLGIPGQTIAGVVSAAACVLVFTGFALAWRRFTTFLRRSRDRGELEKAA